MGKVVDRKEEKKRRPSLSDLRKGAQRKPCSNRLSRRMSLISDAEHLSYLDRFYETDGFDMDGRPGGGIIPLRVSDGSDDCIFKEISQLAIDEYLRRKQRRTFFKHDAPPLKFVKVLKAMSEPRVRKYFVTFEAKDLADGGKTKIYRTIVLWIGRDRSSVLSIKEYKEEEVKETGDQQVIHVCTATELQNQLNAASTTSRLAVLYFSDTNLASQYAYTFYKYSPRKYPKVVFLKVEEGSDMSADWDVSEFPTFIFFKSGKEVDRVVGTSECAFTRMLARHSRKQPRLRRKRVV